MKGKGNAATRQRGNQGKAQKSYDEAASADGAASAGAAPDAPMVLTSPRVRKDKQLFLPSILRWMNDEARRKLYVKSRRIGVTYGHAYDRTARRVKGLRRNAYYTGVSLDMAREYIDYCAFHARMFHCVAEPFEEDYSFHYRDAGGQRRKVDVQAFTIRFPNGAKIVALPSRPAALRGRGGDLEADEWAFHEDPAGLYKAAIHVTKWGGQFAGWSSHNGEGTQFHAIERICRRVLAELGVARAPLAEMERVARRLRLRPVMSYHRTTIVDAVEEGLVELLNRVSGSTHTRESFLQGCRDECLNEEHHNQEYMCVATTALVAALKYHVIEACTHDDCPAPIDEFEQLDVAVATLAEGYAGGVVHIGVDVGRTQDLTVFWVWEAVGDVLWQRLVYRLRNTSMPDQEAALARIIRSVRLGRCAILKRGVGVGIHDHTARTFGEARIVGIDETNPVKVGLAAGIIQAFEDRRVRVAPDDELKENLHAVREQRTPGNLVTYDAPRGVGGHADEFWAGAAGIDCAGLGGQGLTAEDVRVLSRVAGTGRGVPDQRPRAVDVVAGPRGYRW